MIGIKRLVAVLALIGVGSLVPVKASVPALNATIADRATPTDGSGRIFPTVGEVGWKVFVATAGVSAIQLTDEQGNVVTDGQIHMVCVSSGAITENAWVYDSSATLMGTGAATVANSAVNVGSEVVPPMARITTGQLCSSVYDAQFSWGIVVLQSSLGGAGTTHVYWRPVTGGRQ